MYVVEPMPGNEVVYETRAAVPYVAQGRVVVVKGGRVVPLLEVLRQQVREAGRQ